MSTLRRSAKVLVVNDEGRVLLFSGIDRTKPDVPPWWFSVGGRVEAGETNEAAAVREVHEETGLRIADAGPVVLTRRFEWDFEGELYDQEEVYFMARVHSFEPVTTGWTETETATIRGHRWWSIEELRHTEETVYPEGLADLLERLLDV